MGAIARPERVVISETVPRTRSGKIMRRLLRDLLELGSVQGDLTSLENLESLEILQRKLS